ncbi:hypothetical protein Celal_1967 [Cellulophaga algicola DSM 14237]|uniref:Lipoprotein n=1 Tax=Cellulophaga algicola (strain DSM 14237 / IC166 / ACAM 630) TaxID=688270 RepID=E6X3U0_CELAD|nr:hypothetical protein [Cellulophaga algicola]ADV49265.1 hypothetical protein Celal_1967 [Cellulophaga algicola DSM 14237]
MRYLIMIFIIINILLSCKENIKQQIISDNLEIKQEVVSNDMMSTCISERQCCEPCENLPRDGKTTITCLKRNISELHEISGQNEIKARFHYNENCKLDSLSLEFKLDDRSFGNEEDFNLDFIVADIGYIHKDSTYFMKQFNTKEFQKSGINGNVMVSFPLEGVALDTINFIAVSTIGNEREKTLVSNLYCYNNTLFLVDKQKTYLDHKAFLNTNVVYSIVSTKNNIIDKISLTVKTTNIDALTAYNIVVNGTELNFKHSINISFRDSKKEDKGCLLENVLKMNDNYLELKLDVSKLNIKKIDKVEANLR